MEIFTVVYGEVSVAQLVNETPKGYRVKGGKCRWEHIVFKEKQRANYRGPAVYSMEKSFKDRTKAEKFANEQLASMESYYLAELNKINNAKEALGLSA